MTTPTKEEIARVDKAHRRADEAVAQTRAGHIITECIVLYPDENDGTEAKWTQAELDAWPREKGELIQTLQQASPRTVLSVLNHGASYRLPDLPGRIGEPFDTEAKRGRIMYRMSAAYRAIHPPADSYTAQHDPTR